jgi:hypothetical protein
LFLVGAVVAMEAPVGSFAPNFVVHALACAAFVSSVAALIYAGVAREVRALAPVARVGRRARRLRERAPTWLAILGLVGAFLLVPLGC